MTHLSRPSKALRQLIFITLLLALLLQGCSTPPQPSPAASSPAAAVIEPATEQADTPRATAPPTSTPAPKPTATQTATPLPSPTVIPTATFVPTPPEIRTEGWEGVVVGTVCISTSQTGVENVPEFPVFELAKDILPRLGIQVVEEGGNCDADLSLSLNLLAEGENYTTGFCYSGASTIMDATLNIPGQEEMFMQGNSYFAPPPVITGCPTLESQAPFEKAWRGSLFSALGQIWGDSLFVPLWDLPELSEEVRRGAISLDWSTQPEAEVLPVLQQAVQSPDLIPHLGVLRAIERLMREEENLPAFAEIVREVSKDPNRELQLILLDMVGVLGQGHYDVIFEVLIQASQHKDGDIRSTAVERIAGYSYVKERLVGTDVEPKIEAAILDRLYDDDHLFIQNNVLYAIRAWEWMDAIPALIEFLRNYDPPTDQFPLDVSTDVVNTLQSLTGQEIGNDPDGWQAWWDANQP